MERAVKEMEARLKHWRLKIDHLETKTQVAGVQASFEALMYIDELKALHALAQSKLDEFRAAAATDTKRARLKTEMRRALKEIEAMGDTRRTQGRTTPAWS